VKDLSTVMCDTTDAQGNTVQLPATEFLNPGGAYTICGAARQQWLDALVPPAPTAEASFVASATTVPVREPVSFTSTSTGTITGFSWEFGDGNGASRATAQHSFVAPGAYQVTHRVSGPYGDASETQTITVVPAAAAAPVFTG
jgi:PKD repeat protein